jgi:isocitrate dehydrogenase kinase/phosphatase
MPDQKKVQDALRQLDAIDLDKLKVEDIKSVKNPVLAKVLSDFLASKLAESHHNSHFVHISHYSSLARPEEINIATVKRR